MPYGGVGNVDFACLGQLAELGVQHPGFMSVTSIPEGLPVAVALTLMMVQGRMKAVNILPRCLLSMEPLGCINILYSDKTGKMTTGKMTVASMSVAAVDPKFASSEEYYRDGREKKSTTLALRKSYTTL